MEQEITQRKAKVLIRDYLRETGRKGVTSLVRDIHRYTKKPIFTQRTLEKWLLLQDRNLQDDNWEIVLEFIKSKQFRQYVPYASENRADKRLIEVGDGLVALYTERRERKFLSDVLLHPSQLDAQGKEAIKLLSGSWENIIDLKETDAPRMICMIEPVPEKRYAKFAYLSFFGSKQISTTGLVIYINSQMRMGCEYSHLFLLQLWRRKDPNSGITIPSEMYYYTFYFGHKNHQPEFSISKVINQYNYKLSDSTMMDQQIILRISQDRIPEETEIMALLLEDVLPHGYAES